MKPIMIFSTRATDRLYDERNSLLSVGSGGPAKFIEETFRALDVPYVLSEAPAMQVEITISNGTEAGKVLGQLQPALIEAGDKAPAILVSTLLNEWELAATNAPLCVDVQGYLRNCRQLKSKAKFSFSPEVEKSLFAVKGTEEEIAQLDRSLVESLKGKQLIITKGRKGAVLFATGKESRIPARPVAGLKDSVGAGDTWFSAYVAYQFAMGLTPLLAAKKASTFTSNFLERKKYERE